MKDTLGLAAMTLGRGRLAFHATAGGAIQSVQREGLVPQAGSVTRKGERLLFFGKEPQHAYRYFVDREDAYLLRFPFPKDAECGPEECVSRMPVSPESIEVYQGDALDKLLDAYYEDFDSRLDVFDKTDTPALRKKMTGKAGWTPLPELRLGGHRGFLGR